jgi:serine/threonine-protein kinase HipA
MRQLALELLEAASEYFALTLWQARVFIKEVAGVTAKWRDTGKAAGARSREITRMASAFEREDIRRALSL